MLPSNVAQFLLPLILVVGDFSCSDRCPLKQDSEWIQNLSLSLSFTSLSLVQGNPSDALVSRKNLGWQVDPNMATSTLLPQVSQAFSGIRQAPVLRVFQLQGLHFRLLSMVPGLRERGHSCPKLLTSTRSLSKNTLTNPSPSTT